ncbi:MAG: hypoxanthine phosphoribosyltransferase [Mycoplasma sp.]
MDKRIERILISGEEIDVAIKKAAEWVDSTYINKDLVLLTILKGSIPFVGALMPKITLDYVIDYMSMSSFKGQTVAQTSPELIQSFTTNLKGKDVLLVEDIIDSGRTIKEIIEILKEAGCNSIKILTLLDKPANRTVDLEPDYACFTIEPEFIVGFGLDYKEIFRNLPYIGILKKEVYSN